MVRQPSAWSGHPNVRPARAASRSADTLARTSSRPPVMHTNEACQVAARAMARRGGVTRTTSPRSRTTSCPGRVRRGLISRGPLAVALTRITTVRGTAQTGSVLLSKAPLSLPLTGAKSPRTTGPLVVGLGGKRLVLGVGGWFLIVVPLVVPLVWTVVSGANGHPCPVRTDSGVRSLGVDSAVQSRLDSGVRS